MKLLVIGDLHGNKPLIHFKDFDVIIAPGDFCSDKIREYIFQAMRMKIADPKSKIKWKHIVGKNKAKKMLANSIRDGRKILEFLNSFEVPVFVVPGNWEPKGKKWKKMIVGLKNLNDVNLMRKTLDEINFLGYGYVSEPEIPKYSEDKKRLTKKELDKKKKDYIKNKNRLSNLFQKIKNPVIFMPHNVPFRTSLDKIVNKNSPANGKHYGSIIAREMIEEYQPLLCIGGHMHEHFGKCRIGKTIVINAGFGSKVNTLIDLDKEKGKIRSIKFHPRTYG